MLAACFQQPERFSEHSTELWPCLVDGVQAQLGGLGAGAAPVAARARGAIQPVQRNQQPADTRNKVSCMAWPCLAQCLPATCLVAPTAKANIHALAA